MAIYDLVNRRTVTLDAARAAFGVGAVSFPLCGDCATALLDDERGLCRFCYRAATPELPVALEAYRHTCSVCDGPGPLMMDGPWCVTCDVSMPGPVLLRAREA